MSEGVSRSLRFFTDVFYASRSLWNYVGELETALYSKKIEHIEVNRPIYISGLARSGSTILLEMVNSFDGVATHQYKDFPFIFLPIFWSKYHKLISGSVSAKQERVHKDGILINGSSPEAMEELLWMYFFKHIHDPAFNNILDETIKNEEFEKCYHGQLQKILFIRGGERYATKANYNFSRIAYILKLYPDAKFLTPVRNPVNHVFSLIKQHKLFLEMHTKQSYISKHLKRAGHYEFGHGAVPVNMNKDKTTNIIDALSHGDYISAYANQWLDAYAYMIEMQRQYPNNVRFVKYESLCKNLEAELEKIAEFCGLEQSASVFKQFEGKVKPPSYYTLDISESDIATIKNITQSAAEHFQY